MKLRAQYEPENGLVRLKIPKDLKFDEQMANDFLKDLLEQCKGVQHRYLLLDLTENPPKNPSRQYRRWMREHADEMGFERTACVGASGVTRMIGKIIMAAIGRLDTTRFFKTRAEARAWLKGDLN
jgi:hypothetical protein